MLLVLLPASAWACPTCSTATLPALSGDGETLGAYPRRTQRPQAPRIELEGAAARSAELAVAVGGSAAVSRSRVLGVVAADPMGRPSVAAGLTVLGTGAAPDLHVCGPELTLSWTLGF